MKFGLAVMNDFPPGTVPAERLDQLREQVAVAAEAGLSSIWMLQHYLGSMPTLQPVPTLAALSAEARGMDVGTNMLILPLRHPVEVAETYATLDHLTGGHVIAGFGMGYRENEFASFGVPMDERVARYEESVQVIRALWSGRTVHHDGVHFRLDGERISLPPVRPGGPPIMVGAGAHRTGARRAARLGDGWIVPPHVSEERLATVLGWHRAEAERIGDGRRHEYVVRRELVLDTDGERARETGLRARGALTRAYSAYNAPDSSASYRHLGGGRGRRRVVHLRHAAARRGAADPVGAAGRGPGDPSCPVVRPAAAAGADHAAALP
ncbi:LLM class flavin-dependent oxidoreductase [Streptomyces spongiae]|uniref:LLM class flavin-dependent oxidoreductase n=1 Tax=Streptomyces spongiae TaxID=565072 RepID=UPI001D144701|nr:LLM class flavin-dependent oxidoreductase [Streptomyces spongiae]